MFEAPREYSVACEILTSVAARQLGTLRGNRLDDRLWCIYTIASSSLNGRTIITYECILYTHDKCAFSTHPVPHGMNGWLLMFVSVHVRYLVIVYSSVIYLRSECFSVDFILRSFSKRLCPQGSIICWNPLCTLAQYRHKARLISNMAKTRNKGWGIEIGPTLGFPDKL